MNIALIGSGGREHALCQKIYESKLSKNIICIPGNAGTSKIAKNIDIDILDFNKLLKIIRTYRVNLVVVGSEEPLVKGIVDFLRNHKIKVIGPCKYASKLEGSKAFMKLICQKNKIPTANFKICKNKQQVIRFLKNNSLPLVVKADGLAAGKGVTVCETIEESKEAIKDIFSGKFGSAGNKVILEEKIEGPEVSIFALCDGERLIVLPPAQDHKRLLNGDNGPNTGGMGAYAPALLINEQDLQDLTELVLTPTLKGLKKKNINYIGVIYAGLMITSSGPKVIEFNCRFGDPECQALMPLMGEEFASVLFACARGEIENAPKLTFKPGCSACIVAASKGYPENPRKGDKIEINIESNSSFQIFHAGTTIDKFDNIITSGGRVLSVVAQGESFDKAFDLAYSNLKKINFNGMHFREDIGYQFRNI